MTTKTVLKLGNKKLFTKSEPVTMSEFNSDLKQIISDMRQTMEFYKGVGIAAPQIGINKRIIMFGFEHNERYPYEAPVPFTILINPEIKILSDNTVDGWEGCLSIPKLRGLVPRYEKIEYSGLDINGKKLTGIAEGFQARIIQHECDHIDGILFPQRLKDFLNFGFEDEVLK